MIIILLATISVVYCVGPIHQNYFQNQEVLRLHFSIKNSTHTIYTQQPINFLYQTEHKFEFQVPVQIYSYMDNLTAVSAIFRQGDSIPILVKSCNITRYQKIRKQGGKMWQMQGITNKEDENTQYTLHIPPKWSMLLLHLDFKTRDMNLLRDLFGFEQVQEGVGYFYVPLLDTSQLHIPFKTYLPVTNTTHNLTVSLTVYPFTSYQMFAPFANPQLLKRSKPYMADLYNDDMIDEMKELLFTNNFYLLLLLFSLSLTQIFMQIFALKDQIQFWKQISNKGGLSIKVLYHQLVCTFILCAYLYDQGASYFYIIMHLFDVVLTLWKIIKAVSVSLAPGFPFVRLSYKQWYQGKIEQADTKAYSYTSYCIAFLYCLFLVYKLYPVMVSLAYGEAIELPSLPRFYSLFLEISVVFIGVFGFVMMMPQLYINHELKSVDHLPWRTFVYRFISTIIDDIFVFMVTVPTIQICLSFRDDIIFVCYIIQRFQYPVDPTRVALSSGSVDLKQLQKSKVE